MTGNLPPRRKSNASCPGKVRSCTLLRNSIESEVTDYKLSITQLRRERERGDLIRN